MKYPGGYFVGIFCDYPGMWNLETAYAPGICETLVKGEEK